MKKLTSLLFALLMLSITFTSCKKDDPKPEVKNTRMGDYDTFSYGNKAFLDPANQAEGNVLVPEFKNSDIQYLLITETTGKGVFSVDGNYITFYNLTNNYRNISTAEVEIGLKNGEVYTRKFIVTIY
jgi:hypothetical protein